MDRSFSSSVTVVEVDNTDPRDPVARCDRCGIQGTVARAVRHTDPPLVLRYCGQCWPSVHEELDQRQHEDPTPWSTGSRTWYDARQFLGLIAQLPKGGASPTPAILATIAAEIRAQAAEMDGPIPSDIADFLAMHSPPDV
jgi:hypothetical protein